MFSVECKYTRVHVCKITPRISHTRNHYYGKFSKVGISVSTNECWLDVGPVLVSIGPPSTQNVVVDDGVWGGGVVDSP